MKLTGKLVGQVAAVELRNVLVRVILELFRQHWDLRLWDAWRSLVLCDVALRLRSQRQTLPRSTQDTLSAAAFVALLQQGYVTDDGRVWAQSCPSRCSSMEGEQTGELLVVVNTVLGSLQGKLFYTCITPSELLQPYGPIMYRADCQPKLSCRPSSARASPTCSAGQPNLSRTRGRVSAEAPASSISSLSSSQSFTPTICEQGSSSCSEAAVCKLWQRACLVPIARHLQWSSAPLKRYI